VLRGTVLKLSDVARQQVDIELDCRGERLAARITRKSAERLGLQPGLEVFAVLKSVALGNETVDRAPRPIGPAGAD
jgi:molybdate transport system ATP-binding protein